MLALALVGVVVVILAGNKITDSEAELAALESSRRRPTPPPPAGPVRGRSRRSSRAAATTVASLAQSRFDWERVLNELALVIPRRVTLESLTGSAGAGATAGGDTTATGTTDASITGPSLQIGGCAQGQKGVARFLAALKDIDGVTRVGMQSSELGEEVDPAVGAAPTDGAAVTDPASGAAPDCQTGPDIAKFEATVAFDAVPPPVAAAPATPATASAPATAPATPTTTDAATTDGGVAEAEAEKQTAVDSAGEQVSEAKSGAAAAGVSGE